MQLVQSLTTALPLSRLTAYTFKGKYHTFGESLPVPVLPPTTTLSSPSRTVKDRASDTQTQVGEDRSHTDSPPPAQESKQHFPLPHIPGLPNSAWINAHLNPSPSTTVLEVSLALPGTTLHMSRVAPEVNLNPGDKHQGSRYLSGSLVWSGSYDNTATSPDVEVGGTWEGVIASSSTSRAVVTTALTTQPQVASITKSSAQAASSTRASKTTSSVVTTSSTTRPEVTSMIKSSAQESSSIRSSKTTSSVSSSSPSSSSPSSSSTSSVMTPPSRTTSSGASIESSPTSRTLMEVSSTARANNKASTIESSSETSSTEAPSTAAPTQEPEPSPTTTASSTTTESGKNPWWRRLFRRSTNDEAESPRPTTSTPSVTQHSLPTRTVNETVSFIGRFFMGHSKALPIASASSRTTRIAELTESFVTRFVTPVVSKSAAIKEQTGEFVTRVMMGHSEVLPAVPEATSSKAVESR